MDHLSLYLDVADSSDLPYGWSRYAHFSLAVLNQLDPKLIIRKGMSKFTIRVVEKERIGAKIKQSMPVDVDDLQFHADHLFIAMMLVF